MKKLIIKIPNKLYKNIKEIKDDYKDTYSALISVWIDWYIVNMFDRNFKYTKKEWIEEYEK